MGIDSVCLNKKSLKTTIGAGDSQRFTLKYENIRIEQTHLGRADEVFGDRHRSSSNQSKSSGMDFDLDVLCLHNSPVLNSFMFKDKSGVLYFENSYGTSSCPRPPQL